MLLSGWKSILSFPSRKVEFCYESGLQLRYSTKPHGAESIHVIGASDSKVHYYPYNSLYLVLTPLGMNAHTCAHRHKALNFPLERMRGIHQHFLPPR